MVKKLHMPYLDHRVIMQQKIMPQVFVFLVIPQ
jgi:hypothetical protein